ncbi:MAG: biotin transporter BioY [Clostridiales Family XIII bacterium]|jgi:biotin transport system substrate-specific component|nr:biotin transporter BioY [Clostridiales Family XIII bacterium]
MEASTAVEMDKNKPEKNKRRKMSVQDMCLIGIFTGIICVLGQISIPMPYGVPMTLQTFAVPLAGVMLGAKRGGIATLIYVILGAIGVPVFAGFTGGFGHIAGPTGGFILSFPLMAVAAGIGAGAGNKVWLAGGLVVGAVVNYLCGMFMFSLVTANNLVFAFTACVLPFIPTSIIKIVLVAVLGANVKKVLAKRGLAV